VLENGTILESGTHKELMQKEGGLYRYLSQLQFES
jgi:ABC-type multidrug transport system fused ATPase/permease subunit